GGRARLCQDGGRKRLDPGLGRKAPEKIFRWLALEQSVFQQPQDALQPICPHSTAAVDPGESFSESQTFGIYRMYRVSLGMVKPGFFA
ncbi:MAG: hypothetical protein AAEJ57_00105, partial [Opitutales bacterium]